MTSKDSASVSSTRHRRLDRLASNSRPAQENTVYLGDTARAPYGTKSVETVLRYSFENSQFLVDGASKLSSLLANTSTASHLVACRSS